MRALRLIAAVAVASAGLIVMLFMLRLPAQAAPTATCTWIAPADSTPRHWSNGANWSCGAAPGAGDTASVDGGGIVIDVDVPVTVRNLTLATNAELRAYQTLTVTGQMTWTSSSTILGGAALSPIGASETLVIAPGASLTLSHGRFLQGTLVNHGTVQHGNGGVVNALNAVFDNRADGVFASANASLLGSAFPPGPAGVFMNAGTLIKQGSGEYRMEARLTNAGVVSVESDTLRLSNAGSTGVFTHTGAFAVAQDGTLLFDGPKLDFAAASSIHVSGTLRFVNGAEGTVRGAYTGPGLTDLFMAGLTFERPNGAATLTHLNLGSNSWLRGANNITVTSAMTIAGQAIVEGTSSNTNMLDIAPGATLLINQSSGLRFRTLNNYGSIVLAAGQCFNVSNDAVFNNRATGTYNVTAGQMGACLPGTTPGAQFNNHGYFGKSGANQFSFYGGLEIKNSGAIELSGGTTIVAGAFGQTAGETLLRNAATLARAVGWSGDFVFDGGALRGAGTIDFAFPNAVQNNGAVVAPIGLLNITDGGYSQGPGGTLHIDIGGLTPNTQYDVLSVSGGAALNGRLTLSATNGFLPAAGDVFNVIAYSSRSGEFATVDRGLGLAFGPEYQSGGVVISDNPTLVEFSQKPDQRVSQAGDSNGFMLRASNPTTQTITATLRTILPTDFRYATDTATGNLAVGEPVTSVVGNIQSLAWSPVTLAPMTTYTLHFGIAMPTTPGAYTHTATLDLMPATGSVRQLTSVDQISIDRPATTGTEVTVSHGSAYPPAAPNGTWRLTFGRGAPLNQVSVAITTTPVCALAVCGPLAYVAVVHDNQVFTMTQLSPGSDRFKGLIPAGRYSLFEPVFIVPVWLTPTLAANPAGPARPFDDGDDQCGVLNGGAFLTGGQSWCPRRPDIDSGELVDPSGYVTDAQTDAPIQGAMITLYRVPSALPDTRSTTRQCRTVDTRPGGDWTLLPPATANLGLFEEPGYSPATMDPPINPQRTDVAGHYGWDVIRGCWYIKVEAPGYFTRYSAIVGVPPEVTDLDMALTPWPKAYLPLVMR